MNAAQKILLIIGAAFTAMGAVMTACFGTVGTSQGDQIGVFIAIPLLFVVIGISFWLYF